MMTTVNEAAVGGDPDLDQWALDVIETLIRATDDEGRKVHLDHDMQRRVLQRALEWVDGVDADMKPGGAFHDLMAGLIDEATK